MNFEIYKSGQGYYTRMVSALTCGAIVAIGCWRLYEKLTGIGINDPTMRILVQSLVPLAIFIGLSWLIFWLVNNPTVADFLIAAEGEMKKVSWSSRKEIAASTVVVIVVVISMSILLAVADLFFQVFFRAIHVLR